VIPGLLILLSALTVIPVGQGLVEIIVRPVTVGELVDRRVGLSTRLVAVDGFALLVPLDAPPPHDAADSRYVYRWYAVRDSLQEQRLVLVRSPVTPDALRDRSVVARVVDDPEAVDRTSAGLLARGRADPKGSLAGVLLIEEEPGTKAVRDLGSLAELADAKAGELVRVQLAIGDGIATCVGRGACDARSLADGIGTWDYVASDAGGRRAVVRTLYPPSVAPFHGVGHHAQDRELVDSLLALPMVHGLLGWGHVLQAAHVEHDLGLPIDHLWLGPILLTVFGMLVFVGTRLPYPRFRPHPPAHRIPAGQERPGPLPARASGRITPPIASPFEIDDLPATLRRASGTGTELRVQVDGGWQEFLIPRDLGGLGGTEAGDLMMVRARRPALKVDWFGSNLLLVFEEAADRDAANAMVRAPG
jgi:hypothetical protein